MKHWILIIAIMTLVLPSLAFADQTAVGQVDEEEGQQIEYVTVPAYHDSVRYRTTLTEREECFINSVPETDYRRVRLADGSIVVQSLREACREMIRAYVIHLPVGGKYVKNTSGHYWGIYQSWTAPYKVKVPTIEGRPGRDGAPGREGPQGPKGDKGDAGTGITNNYFSTVPAMSMQIGGQTPAMVNNIQLMQMQLIPLSDTNICVSSRVNVSNSNTNVNANSNVINVGAGSATGAAVGNGSSAAGSGN